MSEEPKQDRLLEGDYDGIQEYDNPMPRWWVALFWAAIVFSVLYGLNVPGIGPGKGRIAGYEREMAVAQQRFGSRTPAAGGVPTDAELAALARDPARLEHGKAVFTANCVPCHRADGGGAIGPNLTDDFWIHGGRPGQIFHTISAGVPDKGMPAWSLTLKPDDLPAVTAYVMSLRGTHPASPKAPQGVEEEPDAGDAGGP